MKSKSAKKFIPFWMKGKEDKAAKGSEKKTKASRKKKMK